MRKKAHLLCVYVHLEGAAYLNLDVQVTSELELTESQCTLDEKAQSHAVNFFSFSNLNNQTGILLT